jgi:protein-L-isoaspartate O-methyltransferase
VRASAIAAVRASMVLAAAFRSRALSLAAGRTTEAPTMVARTLMVVARTPMAVAVISSGKLLSTALATASYDACESAIELRS